eukprot:Skav215871  [mRNA]  locus=scaffold2770:75638:94250:- [translate_table: standard]
MVSQRMLRQDTRNGGSSLGLLLFHLRRRPLTRSMCSDTFLDEAMDSEEEEEKECKEDAGGPPTGYVPSRAAGTAVDEQLAAVQKEELDLISQQLCEPGGQVQAIDLQEVKRLVKHIEVDREELAQRCHRLAQENKDPRPLEPELLEVNGKLEAALYVTKKDLEDATRPSKNDLVRALRKAQVRSCYT